MAKSKLTKKKIKQIVTIAILAISLVITLLATYFPESGLPSREELFGTAVASVEQYPCAVHFLDVGQADCSIMKTEDAVIMIDAGDVDAFSKIEAYLRKLQIQKIDYLILTHAHSDHIGSADDVLRNYPVENVIMPRYTEENMPTSKVYEDLLLALQEAKPKIMEAKPGNTYDIGALSMQILAPNRTYKEMNNSSVVTRITYKNRVFLFQGDAEKQSEKDILESGLPVTADVLKLGHHGSKTSSIEAYLDAVHPSFAVISCGVNNKYGLPSEPVLERLESRKIEYRRTDVNGDIVVATDGDKLYLETEKES